MGIRHYQDVVGVVQMYDDSISFFRFFKDLSNAIDFAPVDWVMLLIFLSAVTWILYERRQKVPDGEIIADSGANTTTAPSEAVTDILQPEKTPDPDEELVKQNPGNHAAVIRLIVKAETVDEIDKLHDGYINSPSHHKAYEIDVIAVHYLKKSQLLIDKDERAKWYMGGRIEILRKHGFTPEQFIKALSDAEKKYPELFEDW